MGLYYCLQESISFRLEPCLYIRNLAAPDMLVWWGEKIPLISRWWDQWNYVLPPISLYLGPYFNLLPVIAVALMVVYQALMTPPAMDEQQEMNMKMMKWMSIVFGFMFYKVAAGLCMYFIASSLWGLAERKLQGKKKTEPVSSGDAGGGSELPAPAPAPSRPKAEPKRPKAEARQPAGNGLFQRIQDWWQDVLREAAKQQQARRDPRDDEPERKRKR
jgi:hypothetical protein